MSVTLLEGNFVTLPTVSIDPGAHRFSTRRIVLDGASRHGQLGCSRVAKGSIAQSKSYSSNRSRAGRPDRAALSSGGMAMLADDDLPCSTGREVRPASGRGMRRAIRRGWQPG